ncbi:MAG: DMT family transporter [Halobacteriales archaeon]|nr:DMT family transporter [Halobacteriales archaeon]
MKESTTGTLLVLGAAAGFGTIGIFGELAAAIDLRLATLLPTRFALATLVVLALSRLRGWPLLRTRRDLATTFALGLVYTGLTLFFFVSLRHLTAGLATIVLYTYPAIVFALAATFLGERVTRAKLAALAAVLAGVVLIVDADAAGADPLGVALALGAAACYALYTTGSRTLVSDLDPRALMLGVLLGTTAGMVGFALLTTGLALPDGRTQWGVVLGLTLVGTLVPLLLFYEGVSRLEASRVGVISTVEPVVTVALGALLLGEAVTPAVVAGGALVLGGVLLVQRGGDLRRTVDYLRA